MDLINLEKSVKTINSETLPEVASLANGVIGNAAKLLDGMLTGVEACAADALTVTDGILDRKLAALNEMLAPVRQIVNGGLSLKGTIGGMPVDLTLAVKGPTE